MLDSVLFMSAVPGKRDLPPLVADPDVGPELQEGGHHLLAPPLPGVVQRRVVQQVPS